MKQPTQNAPRTEDELEDRLSRPDTGVREALRNAPGDVIVLGAGGKMGPSLARMLRRAADDGRQIIAVSRWSDASRRAALDAWGVTTQRADLADPSAYDELPDAANVVYMAGQKFGTADAPHRTWIANVVLPAYAASRFRTSRIVAFSSGNVYPRVPVSSRGALETDPLSPVGEYAMSCVGRERVFEHAAATFGTRVALVRLNYAVDLRYGVLVDIAQRVRAGTPLSVTMGHVNVIWQGDANARAIRCLPLAASPPMVVNVTGIDALRVRDAATRLGVLLGKTPAFEGSEAPDALLSDASLSQQLFGAPGVSTEELLQWVAAWVGGGGRLLGKPTHFEERGGVF